MKATQLKDYNCPACKRAANAATSVGESAEPGPGDISVCIACGHLFAFSDDMTGRELTDDEIMEVAGNPIIIAIQKCRAQIMAEQEHRYIPLLRPASMATLPDGVCWDYVEAPRDVALKRLDLPISSHRYGMIKTNRPLTFDELMRFDLRPV